MQKIIIIKYGELSTKKDNIGYFLNTLKNNIKEVLIDEEVNISLDIGRMFIEVQEESIPKVVAKLKKIFGIHEIIVGYKDLDFTLDALKENTLKLLEVKDFKTFKINTKRSNKKYPYKSMELNNLIGSYILDNKKVKVDVLNPEVIFNIEIRQKEILYYDMKIKGLGGYPVGTLGKGLLMLSGGIDSPVAGFLAAKRGIMLEAIYFESPPHTSENAKNKVLALATILSEYSAKIKVHIVNFTAIQEAILKNIPNDYLITIMRRMMYRISEQIALKNKCLVLINGESIGQVASQTLTSMNCINAVVNMPVIRPVACYDKLQIIDMAKNIGSYETSILPYEDCCTVFVPQHPVINPSLKKACEYEKLIDYEALIKEAILNEKIIYVPLKEEAKYQDIL